MKLQIFSPEKTIYDGNVDSVLVPGRNRRPFMILDSYTPLISTLEDGIIRYVADDKEHEIQISSGFIEVRKDVVSICVEL
ncbi:hypothetical protein LJC25_04015 [Bacteroidales bacterium OttesenSCG-928-K03]|nr:hypothetical protein [Bacteroidales bacterium OttesenSCG-928-L14]MDL2240311.1 hypothetical protein [Bacteroidales bacterium OttesenSCG-928-K22]MDL2242875.1 hypothetical protein [Bacteroidales bacterium OttesenSCG-928-K03]